MSFFSSFDFPNSMWVLKTVSGWDAIDILIIAYIIYIIAKFFKGTRSMQVLLGIAIIVGVLQLSGTFGLNTINFILQNAMQVGFFAIIVLFQNELRTGLSKMGRSRIFFFNFEDEKNDINAEVISAVTTAAKYLSERKIGALIVIERNTKIDDSIISGIPLDAKVSSELLINIFYPKAPLHDGAAVISDGKIKSAGCILPLSQKNTLASELGTRHRAGLGITEVSDSVVVVVSEETGKIMLANYGFNQGNINPSNLEKSLKNLIVSDKEASLKSKWRFNIKKGDKKAKKEGANKND